MVLTCSQSLDMSFVLSDIIIILFASFNAVHWTSSGRKAIQP